MLDGKILAAVLATLAAFGLASGGQPDAVNPAGDLKIPDMSNLDPRTIGAFTGLIPEDKSTSEVEATLNYNSSSSQSAVFTSETLEVENLTSISTQKRTIKSPGNISLERFDGKVTSGPMSTFKGTAGSVIANEVNISGGLKVEKTLETSRIKAVGVKNSGMRFDEVSGTITSETTSADLSKSGTDVKIDTFNGTIEFRPTKGEIYIDGEVKSLKAGDFSIS